MLEDRINMNIMRMRGKSLKSLAHADKFNSLSVNNKKTQNRHTLSKVKLRKYDNFSNVKQIKKPVSPRKQYRPEINKF